MPVRAATGRSSPPAPAGSRSRPASTPASPRSPTSSASRWSGTLAFIDNTATQIGAVTARVGEYANLNGGTGGVDITADYDGLTTAVASAFTVGGLFSAGRSDSTANHTATVQSIVGTGADIAASGGAGISIATTHNDDQDTDNDGVVEEGAVASADNMSFSIIVTATSSESKANANVTASTTVAAGATFNAPNGAITVTTTSRNLAFAALQSISAAFVRVDIGKASPVATGTTTTTFAGNVGSVGSAGAASLVVSASALTYSMSTLVAAGGGFVSVGTGTAKASSTPTLTTSFGANGRRGPRHRHDRRRRLAADRRGRGLPLHHRRRDRGQRLRHRRPGHRARST